jgi:hypothetical protein
MKSKNKKKKKKKKEWIRVFSLALSLSLDNNLAGSLRESKQGTNGTCKRAQTTTHTQLPARRRLMNKTETSRKFRELPTTVPGLGWGKKPQLSNSMGRVGWGRKLNWIELNWMGELSWIRRVAVNFCLIGGPYPQQLTATQNEINNSPRALAKIHLIYRPSQANRIDHIPT